MLGYLPKDPGNTKQLEEHGILVRLSAEDEVREYHQSFLEALVDCDDELGAHCRLSDEHLRLHDHYVPNPGEWLGPALGYHLPELAWVHGTELGRHLSEELFHRRLGITRGHWVGMSPKLAEVFEAGLSGQVARAHGLGRDHRRA